MKELIAMLDGIADRLEKECLFKEAEELDVISNTIEKLSAIQPTPEQQRALRALKQHSPGKDAEFVEDKGKLMIKFTNPEEKGGVWKDKEEVIEPTMQAVSDILGY